MIRGTRIIEGEEAIRYTNLLKRYCEIAKKCGYKPIILPALWWQETFIKKAGPEIIGQMWAFKDKGDRDVCLIPEATAVVQEYFAPKLKSMSLPHRIFYVQKCYRYERPQAGRYREFTQFGIECLGPPDKQDDVVQILRMMMDASGVNYAIDGSVKRGLHYYVGNGFEASCKSLGAQKQVAGGGQYENGVGFAIGVDRVLLAQEIKEITLESA